MFSLMSAGEGFFRQLVCLTGLAAFGLETRMATLSTGFGALQMLQFARLAKLSLPHSLPYTPTALQIQFSSLNRASLFFSATLTVFFSARRISAPSLLFPLPMLIKVLELVSDMVILVVGSAELVAFQMFVSTNELLWWTIEHSEWCNMHFVCS
jgi:hypothetical protein